MVDRAVKSHNVLVPTYSEYLNLFEDLVRRLGALGDVDGLDGELLLGFDMLGLVNHPVRSESRSEVLSLDGPWVSYPSPTV